MIFFPVAAFFGIYLVLGGVVAVRRGLDPTAIEVGADGVWLPGLGLRPWSEFSDVRLETYRGPAGGSGRRRGVTRVATYQRLGFVPRDPALAGA